MAERTHTEPILSFEEDPKKKQVYRAAVEKYARDQIPELLEEPTVWNTDETEENMNIFRFIISHLRWKNYSDGLMSQQDVIRMIIALPARYKAILVAIYDRLYIKLEEALATVLGECDSDKFAQARIISHFIAMGSDTYDAVLSDQSLALYFIKENECQPFNEIIDHFRKK